jgi:hypothetical protein
VNLPSAASANSTVTLTFTYSGPLANEDNSPVPGVRLASIYKDGTYLLLPARWFPLTAYPTNRYTATFRLTVPDTFALAGTGKSLSPSAVPAKSAAEGGGSCTCSVPKRSAEWFVRGRPAEAECETI